MITIWKSLLYFSLFFPHKDWSDYNPKMDLHISHILNLNVSNGTQFCSLLNAIFPSFFIVISIEPQQSNRWIESLLLVPATQSKAILAKWVQYLANCNFIQIRNQTIHHMICICILTRCSFRLCQVLLRDGNSRNPLSFEMKIKWSDSECSFSMDSVMMTMASSLPSVSASAKFCKCILLRAKSIDSKNTSFVSAQRTWMHLQHKYCNFPIICWG